MQTNSLRNRKSVNKGAKPEITFCAEKSTTGTENGSNGAEMCYYIPEMVMMKIDRSEHEII